MLNETNGKSFETELVDSFTIDEVERRLEMTFYCCTGGDFGIDRLGETCCSIM